VEFAILEAAMPTDEPLTITLSPEMSRRVRQVLVENGYASAEHFIVDALDALEPADPEFERWVAEEAIPAVEEYERDPSTGRTPDQIRATLEAEYHRALKAG
jgi:Arc/MetJ-type ribon-helix-helix transcriptional regulator